MCQYNGTQGVYSITNITNGHMYIGSTVDIRGRWNRHKSDLCSNKHHNQYLQRAWNKYGEDDFVFQLIEQVPLADNLTKVEQSYLDALEPEYNIANDAEHPMLGKEMPKEARQKISQSLQGRKPWNTGKSLDEETKKKMSEAHQGKEFGEEFSQKVSEALEGREFTEEHCKNISEALQGREFDEEWLNKLSESHKGFNHTEETKEKLSQANQGHNNPSSKLTKKDVIKIKQMLNSTDLTYSEISQQFPVNRQAIGKINRGDRWAQVNLEDKE